MNSFYSNIKVNHSFKENIILDLGANAGLEAKKIYDVFNGAKAILVEPSYENIIQIYENIGKWGLKNNFFVEHCCVDTKNGWATFCYELSKGVHGRPNGSLDEFNWKTWNYNFSSTVRTKTVESICNDCNIIKIDIERHEYKILPDVVKLPRFEIAYVELHGPCYELSIINFFKHILKDTNIKITGWYRKQENQNSIEDTFYEIPPLDNINCGDNIYVILESYNEN